MADDCARGAPEAREAGHDRGVVGELPVAVNLGEVLEEERDEIEGVRPQRVPRDERLLPRRQLRVDFVRDFGKLLAELVNDSLTCGLRFQSRKLFDLPPYLKDRLFELRRVAVHAGGP